MFTLNLMISPTHGIRFDTPFERYACFSLGQNVDEVQTGFIRDASCWFPSNF